MESPVAGEAAGSAMATSLIKQSAARKTNVRKRKKRIPVRVEISALHKDIRVLECIEIASEALVEVPLKHLGREIKPIIQRAPKSRKRRVTRTA